MENLWGRRHAARQLERGFAEENETRGIVFVSDAVFAVDADAIEKCVASNKKCLHTARRPAFDEFGDISFLADGDVHRDPGIAQIERHVLADLAIVRHRDADLVFARAQFARQRLEHVHERGSPSERRSFRADHQNTHAKKSNRGLRGLHGWERSNADSGYIRGIRVIRG